MVSGFLCLSSIQSPCTAGREKRSSLDVTVAGFVIRFVHYASLQVWRKQPPKAILGIASESTSSAAWTLCLIHHPEPAWSL